MMLLYPSGWQPARIYMYSLAKMNKPRAANATPPFRLISSSIGAIWPNFRVEFLRLGGRLHHQRKPWHKTKCFWSEKAFPMDVFATAETHFIFNSTYYNQVNGVAMCSPPSPPFSLIFSWATMRRSGYNGIRNPKYHSTIINLICGWHFCLFNSEWDGMLFFQFINNQHPNIHFHYREGE